MAYTETELMRLSKQKLVELACTLGLDSNSLEKMSKSQISKLIIEAESKAEESAPSAESKAEESAPSAESKAEESAPSAESKAEESSTKFVQNRIMKEKLQKLHLEISKRKIDSPSNKSRSVSNAMSLERAKRAAKLGKGGKTSVLDRNKAYLQALQERLKKRR